MNRSTIDTSFSPPSSYLDTITNTFFGLCALTVGIITIWQARRALRRRYIAHHGNSLDEEDQAHPVISHELGHFTSQDQDTPNTVDAHVNLDDDPIIPTAISSTEDASPRDSLEAAAVSSTFPETTAAMGYRHTDGPATPESYRDFPSSPQLPLLSGARPVLEENASTPREV